jgi:hypothetical protein
MKLRLIFPILALMTASVFGADIDGKWTGSLDSPNGAIQLGFNFKADGATLTGSTIGPDGMELKISNGKIDGNKISFDVAVDFGGMPFTLSYTGVLSGTSLALKLDFAGMPVEFTVKKA